MRSAAVFAYARSTSATASRLSPNDDRSWIELLSRSAPPTTATMTNAYLRKSRVRAGAADIATGASLRRKWGTVYRPCVVADVIALDASTTRDDSRSADVHRGRTSVPSFVTPLVCEIWPKREGTHVNEPGLVGRRQFLQGVAAMGLSSAAALIVDGCTSPASTPKVPRIGVFSQTSDPSVLDPFRKDCANSATTRT